MHLHDISLITATGNLVSAVNGGGAGGTPPAGVVLQTDRTVASTWETFTVNVTLGSYAATLQTEDGYFVTAVGGGGIGPLWGVPFSSDRSQAAAWEIFRLGN